MKGSYVPDLHNLSARQFLLAGRKTTLSRHVANRMFQRLAVAVDQDIPGAGVGHRKPGVIPILYAQNIHLGLPLCLSASQMNVATF